MNRCDYLKEAYHQLNENNYYSKLNYNPMQDLIMNISTFTSHLVGKSIIDTSIFRFLTPSVNARTPIFYMLPKIHKPNVPGRPIISGCNSPTANLSKYMDHYLKPIVRNIASYIQDTTHFLRILKEQDGLIPPDALLVMFDVRSLYTNIPTDLGIQYTLRALLEFYDSSLPLPIQHMEQILNFILKNNHLNSIGNFIFNLQGRQWVLPLLPTMLISLWTELKNKS